MKEGAFLGSSQAQENSGSVPHQSRGLEGGLQKRVYPSFVYLIFFIAPPSPSQKLGRLQPLASTRFSIWGNPPHFRAIKRHSLPIPSLPTTYTRGCQLWILAVKPQGGCTKGSVGL